MPAERFQNQYRIPSSRATWHEYNGGMYFVTVCTQNKEHYFGEIQDGVMHLTEIGEYTQDCVQNIPSHNPYAEVPLFIIMPNHIHLVVTIDGDDCRDVPWRVSTDGKNKTMQKISNRQDKLSTTIGTMKQAITRYARQHDLPFAWQPRFHDRIIRNNTEMNQIAEYIENNVARWEYDRFYE
ncbi:MAG: transposase [Bacteroidales bacterium]|nr:transposase [Bacteroidales bacterium]